MAVCGAHDVGAGGVHGVVDHVGCCVEEADFAAVDDFAFGVDEDEVGGFDEGEGDAEGVDPELVGVDGVLVMFSVSQLNDWARVAYSERDVASYTLIEAVLAKDAERSSKSPL